MARQQAMAQINAAIQQAAQQPKQDNDMGHVVKPHAAIDPAVVTGVPGAKGSQQYQQDKADKAKQLTSEQEDILKHQEELLGEEQAEEERKKQEALNARSAFVKTAEDVARNGSRILKQADLRIGNIPHPGSILFPLVILLFFFFLLIQIGPYTRLGWFWQVITGNAQISDTLQNGPLLRNGEMSPGQSGDTGRPNWWQTVDIPNPFSANGMTGSPY